VAGDTPVDLVGHSMGGNVAMIYAGVRPARIRRLVNLEGFGMPQTQASSAPRRYAKWLDELKTPQHFSRNDSLEAVAARMRRTHPLLRESFANWLAPHWARQEADGRWGVLGDPAHKRVNPVLYRREEALACWSQITAPVMWVEGSLTDMTKVWGDRYPREDFEARLAVIPRLQRHVLPDAAHMLHHDQPEALAALIEGFLAAD
jgi:pimeloyl-ACP methyl ester carboxylesterase